MLSFFNNKESPSEFIDQGKKKKAKRKSVRRPILKRKFLDVIFRQFRRLLQFQLSNRSEVLLSKRQHVRVYDHQNTQHKLR